jgi:cytochrome c553
MQILKVIASIIIFSASLSFQVQPDKEQIEKGRKLSKSCTNCHGTTAKGATAFPLQRIRQFRTQDWLVKMVYNPAGFMNQNEEAAALFNGKPIMQAFPQFSKSDINAIFDYFDSLPYDPKNYKHRRGWKPL